MTKLKEQCKKCVYRMNPIGYPTKPGSMCPYSMFIRVGGMCGCYIEGDRLLKRIERLEKQIRSVIENE